MISKKYKNPELASKLHRPHVYVIKKNKHFLSIFEGCIC